MLRRRLMTEDKMDVIHFQDPEVKRILVEHIDTDGDGEISYEEALACTSFQYWFQENTSIESFNELIYFPNVAFARFNGKGTFQGCTNLKSVKVAFIAHSTIQEDWVFRGCTGLKQVDLTGSTQIDGYAFAECSGLEKIFIPNTITVLYEGCLNGCSALSEIEFEEGGTSLRLGRQFLYKCSSLLNLYLPNIPITLDGDVFGWWDYYANVWFSSLKPPTIVNTFGGKIANYIVPDDAYDAYKSLAQFGSLYNVYRYSWTLPINFEDEEVERICVSKWASSFYSDKVCRIDLKNVKSLENVFANNTIIKKFNELQYFVVNLNWGAQREQFTGCTSLEEVTLPSDCGIIPGSLFKNCALKTIDIPHSVYQIDNNSFEGCPMEQLIIPNSVKSIAAQFIKNMPTLKRVIFEEGNEDVGLSINGASTENDFGTTKLEYLCLPKRTTGIHAYTFRNNYSIPKWYFKMENPSKVSTTWVYGEYIEYLYVPIDSVDLYKTNDTWGNTGKVGNIIGYDFETNPDNIE